MVHCKICLKKTFFSKSEFLQAHGGKITYIPASPWVTKEERKGKSPFFSYKVKCRDCGVNKPPHKSSCSYYSEPDSVIKTVEFFDWESYWRWWFGVETLDLNSKRFFGKY